MSCSEVNYGNVHQSTITLKALFKRFDGHGLQLRSTLDAIVGRV